MDIFNVWDLERVNIKLKKQSLNNLNKQIFSKFKTKREAYNYLFSMKDIPFSVFKNLLKPSYLDNFFVPLNFYLKTAQGLGVSIDSLQEDIVSYKTAGGPNYIFNPILPIRINPVFDMLFAHHIADGTVINPKKGRLPYFGYRQFNEFYRVAYVKKIEFVFGKINYKKDYILSSTRPYCPPVLSSLFFKYYNFSIEDFLSDKARIPKVIFDKGKDSMLAVLIAFIIDEGHIDSTQITIGLKNKLLVEDLGKICSILGYNYKITSTERKDYIDYGYLSILREGMKRMYSDYLILNEGYPIIDLGWKGKKIIDSFKIYNRFIKRTRGNQKVIYSILQKECLSVNQLASRINMTRQGVRYHIHNLLKNSKIKLINDSQLNWLYGV